MRVIVQRSEWLYQNLPSLLADNWNFQTGQKDLEGHRLVLELHEHSSSNVTKTAQTKESTE
jgi:hypothetical protein